MSPDLRPACMELLCSLATQLGRTYECFVPVIQRILNKHKIVNPKYDILVAKVVKVGILPILYFYLIRSRNLVSKIACVNDSQNLLCKYELTI